MGEIAGKPKTSTDKKMTQVALGRNKKPNRPQTLNSGFDCKKEFFKELLGPVEKVAKQYNFDPNYLLAISALESGWLGAHAHELNNAFGLTKGGGNNLEFKNFSESVEFWGKTFGSKASGAVSIDDFISKLQTDLRKQGGNGKYNTVNPKWGTEIRNAYHSVLKRRGPLCECNQPENK
ncbi:MAG: glucosaminidase domain-containing protein [Desulfuromonadales bacterium]|nr:glucosaminidase domain-containing protein [Desulfuromonadales bacterium]